MSVSEPGKIITPWAESGLKNPIPPAANPATGRAGFDQGFSAINMTAKEAGGIPPFGQDFNGIFYEVTNILRYMQAGGQPTFDSALAAAIGGYPKGAMVLGSDGVTLWQSKVDSNSTDPNVDPANWGTFDIGLKADLSAPNGSDIVGFQQAGAGSAQRTAQDKMRDTVSVKDFWAKGDGVSDDTAAFATLEASVTGRVIDLHGLRYAVASIPAGNIYVNGIFVVGGRAYTAAQDRVTLSGNAQGYGGEAGTGTLSSGAYTGGVLHNPTTAGRSSSDLYALIASQNSVAEGPSRAINVGSIYCWATGNVSGNYTSRHSLAFTPQSVNIASEECRVVGGFRGANLASIYSSCENESNANVACRNSAASSRNGANFASDGSLAGRGGKALLVANVAGGVLQSVTCAVGNDGVTVFNGVGYSVGDPLVFFDTLAPSPVLPVVSVGSVDANGAITGFAYASMGSGLTDGGVNVKIDNGTGDFSANIATIGCNAEGLISANIAQGASKASGSGSANVAGDTNTSSGIYSATLAATRCTASAETAVVVASQASSATGEISAVLAGNNCIAGAAGAVVLGRRTINNVTRSIAFGDGSSGAASTANRKFHVFSNGNVQAAGTITGSTIFADYAEYFENAQAGVIPLGALVTLEGRHVRPVQPGDDILGVVSATALLVAGDSPFTWSNRYLTGEFGEPLYHDIPDPDWESMIPDPDWPRYIPNPAHPVMDLIEMEDGTTVHVVASTPTIPNPEPAPLIPNLEPRPLIRVQVENPDFDPDKPNIPRSERPEEWSCIGLLGQVHVRVKGDVAVGDWVRAGADGVGQLSDVPTNLRCMEIRAPYDGAKGYAVAFCLLR